MRGFRFDPDVLGQRSERWIALATAFVDRTLRPYHRAEVRGLDRVPEGPVLYVGNHSGGAVLSDAFINFSAVYRALGIGAMPYGLGHDLAVTLPVFNQVLVPLGAVRASRENLRTLLGQGHKVAVYPGGYAETFRPFRDRDQIRFGSRCGYVREAIRAGVPIVPLVTAGAHEQLVVVDDLPWLARLLGLKRFKLDRWPLVLSLPWGLTLFPPPVYLPWPAKFLSEFLQPIHFERSGVEASRDEAYVVGCKRVIESRMQAALARLAEERRTGRGAEPAWAESEPLSTVERSEESAQPQKEEAAKRTVVREGLVRAAAKKIGGRSLTYGKVVLRE